MTKYIYQLKEIYQTDRDAVGGKAVNLGDMSRGLDVPAGFCLATGAYSENLKHYGLNEKIGHLMAGLNTDQISKVEEVSAAISKLIEDTPLLPEIELALRTAFTELRGDNSEIKVAVRSSASAEDLVDASFAGLQETFLNVTGIEEVLLSVKKCWASLWTTRAIHYRNQKSFAHEQVFMAVIIQEMVPAAVSGVMFTANPVNNRRDEIRIEAVRGLGEQLVSGQTAGDIYILHKTETNVELISKTIADPEKGQMINDYDIRELAHHGLKIEIYYEDYQDVEWAYYQGKFYFLQTRSITTLADEKLPEVDLGKMSKMQEEVVEWVAERFPVPIYPVDGVVVKIFFMAQFEAMRNFGFSVAEMDWSRLERGMFPEFFTPPEIRSGIKRLFTYLRLFRTLRLDPAAEWAKEQVYLLDTLRKLKGRDISTLPFEIIIDYITEALNHFHYFGVMRYEYFVQNRIPGAVLPWILRRLFGESGQQVYEDLMAGSHNVTLEINAALRELALAAEGNAQVKEILTRNPLEAMYAQLALLPEGQAFLEKFNEFLGLYGERETSMGLGAIASPTWQDTPQVVFGIIRGLLNEEKGAEEAREEKRLERSRSAEQKIYDRLSQGILSILPVRNFIGRMIKHSRSFAAFRENSHYDVTRSLHVFRILFTELGHRFVRRSILLDPSDIFYLTYFEIKDITFTIYHGLEDVDVKALSVKVKNRREEQERRLSRWQMRHVKFNESAAIKGIPASHGIVSGPARIIRDPGDFHKIQKGDILIAPYTNPAWTPLFTTTGGLVVETGGAASHAAIIAREYGIPAVMGAAKATELLTDGEIITVNGVTGNVHRDKDKEQIKD